MIRVLMTADTVGGVWTYALELARSLVPLGVEVALATMGAPLTASQRAESAGMEVHESRYHLEWMDNPWSDVASAGDWLFELERRLRPHVIHVNGYVHAALPWKAPVLAVAHSCVLSWWRAVHGEDAPASWTRYRDEVARGVHCADLVAAPSRAMLAEVSRWYGPPRTGMVIPNGRSRSMGAGSEKEPIVSAAGRLWDEAKNLAALDTAAESLPWPVYVAGDTQHPDGTRRDARNARALGVLPAGDVARWMGRAGIYALPAHYEPFGLSVLEAALAGCALVLGDIRSLRENWEGAAEFVDPADATRLHAVLAQLMYDSAHRARLAAAARIRAKDFSPERMAQAYLAAYHVLMSERRLHKHAGSSRHQSGHLCHGWF